MKAIYRLVTLLLAPVIALTADSKLVQYRITTTRQDGAVQSILYVKEVERTEASSIVEITYEPRRFGPDLGDIHTATCFVLRTRGEQFVFVKILTQEQPFRFDVTFPASDPLEGELHEYPMSAERCKAWLHF